MSSDATASKPLQVSEEDVRDADVQEAAEKVFQRVLVESSGWTAVLLMNSHHHFGDLLGSRSLIQ